MLSAVTQTGRHIGLTTRCSRRRKRRAAAERQVARCQRQVRKEFDKDGSIRRVTGKRQLFIAVPAWFMLNMLVTQPGPSLMALAIVAAGVVAYRSGDAAADAVTYRLRGDDARGEPQ